MDVCNILRQGKKAQLSITAGKPVTLEIRKDELVDLIQRYQYHWVLTRSLRIHPKYVVRGFRTNFRWLEY